LSIKVVNVADTSVLCNGNTVNPMTTSMAISGVVSRETAKDLTTHKAAASL
jgi:hypothetical protein